MTSARLGKIAGWLLVIGPLVDTLVSSLRPGVFPGQNPDGHQAAMQEAILGIAPHSTLVNLLVDLGFVASFGLLVGFWGLKEVMGDSGSQGYLRKLGMLFLMIGLSVRTGAFAMNFLMSVTLSYTPAEALTGEALNTAVMFMVMGGALGVFATILTLVGVAFFAGSLMNVHLLGADRLLARLLGVAPAIVGSLLLLLATFREDSVFTLYLLGNAAVFFQIAWVIMVGVALIRKSDSLATLTA
ncbi:MAG: hypothetical protein OXS29_07865 [bacterium]|nr:hypothetical protein [bacterium]MDE0287359.1 hypothetical protein [bacterium]MDE0439178.1 hypothetical protein [bacterium]